MLIRVIFWLRLGCMGMNRATTIRVNGHRARFNLSSWKTPLWLLVTSRYSLEHVYSIRREAFYMITILLIYTSYHSRRCSWQQKSYYVCFLVIIKLYFTLLMVNLKLIHFNNIVPCIIWDQNCRRFCHIFKGKIWCFIYVGILFLRY